MKNYSNEGTEIFSLILLIIFGLCPPLGVIIVFAIYLLG